MTYISAVNESDGGCLFWFKGEEQTFQIMIKMVIISLLLWHILANTYYLVCNFTFLFSNLE